MSCKYTNCKVRKRCKGDFCSKHKKMLKHLRPINGRGIFDSIQEKYKKVKDEVSYRVKSLIDKDFRNTTNKELDEFITKNNLKIKDIKVANSAVPLFILPVMLFGGYFANSKYFLRYMNGI